MSVTKKELAEKLGVSKQTVANYLAKLGIAAEHVKRLGNTDYLDEFAVSALADAIGKSVPSAALGSDAAPEHDDVVLSALKERIGDLKEENERLARQLESEQAAHEREVAELREQLADANDRAARLAERMAGIAERQQAFAALPWWKRGALAVRLLGSGNE